MYVIFKFGFEEYGRGIVLIGRGIVRRVNCPGVNCPGVNCPFPGRLPSYADPERIKSLTLNDAAALGLALGTDRFLSSLGLSIC